MTTKLRIVIASHVADLALVAEIWCECGMFAEIRFEENSTDFVIELFPLPDKRPVRINLKELEETIQHAKKRLREIEGY